MNIRAIGQIFSLREIRNAVVGLVVVFGGLGLTALTLIAHEYGDSRLAGISAGASLIFALLIVVFVVPPLARNASREASQMNVPFEFTTGGAIMVGLLLVVGFSAWNTGNNLLFLVLSFLIAAMIVGTIAGRITLQKLDVKLRFPETIFAGEPTPILISLTNRKRIFPSMSVVVEIRGHLNERSIAADEMAAILPRVIAERLSRPASVRRTLDHMIYVPRNETVESRTEHVFDQRERFLIKDFELSTRFPFGFLRHRRRLPARETELIVFPVLAPADDTLFDTPLDAGRMTSQKHGLGQDLLALRDYRPDDDLRRIDWKATARAANLTVREFAAEDELRVTVFFDTRISDSERREMTLREKLSAEQRGDQVILSERFEHGVSTVAAILTALAESHAEIRLVIGGEDGERGASSVHLHGCLKRLATIQPDFVTDGELSEPGPIHERMLNDPGIGHRILVTANDERGAPPETLERLKIIGF